MPDGTLASTPSGSSSAQDDIHIGVTPWSAGDGWSADRLCAQAEWAEASGFHSFWLPENHFSGPRAVPSPMLLLAAVAARTGRIKLGTTSYLLPVRHPLLAAEEVAVLDQLCGGRLILGLGRGIQDTMFQAFDLPRRDKRKLFAANLQVMRAAWRGEALAVDAQGEPVLLSPLPLQKPWPPLWVAAFGPLALRQVGQLGLPYLASPIEQLPVLEHNYARHRRALDEAGHTGLDTVPVMRTIFVTNQSRLAERTRKALAAQIPAAMLKLAGRVQDWALVGDRHCVRDKLQEYIERLSISHLIVRAGLPGVADEQQRASLEQIVAMAPDLVTAGPVS